MCYCDYILQRLVSCMKSKCKHVSGKIHTKIYDVHSVDHLVQKNFIGHGELIFGKNEKLFSWNGIKFNGGE